MPYKIMAYYDDTYIKGNKKRPSFGKAFFNQRNKILRGELPKVAGELNYRTSAVST